MKKKIKDSKEYLTEGITIHKMVTYVEKLMITFEGKRNDSCRTDN